MVAVNNKPFWVGVILSPVLIAVLWFAATKPQMDTSSSINQAPMATFDFIPTTDKVELSGRTFDKLNLEDGSKTNVSFKEFAGKPIVVHFWATWCGACVEEMPALVKFAEKNADKINFVIIATDASGGSDVLEYCKTNDIKNINVFIDTKGGIVRDQDVKALPTTVFAGSDTIEAGRVIGSIDWQGQSGDLIQSYLTKGA